MSEEFISEDLVRRFQVHRGLETSNDQIHKSSEIEGFRKGTFRYFVTACIRPFPGYTISERNFYREPRGDIRITFDAGDGSFYNATGGKYPEYDPDMEFTVKYSLTGLQSHCMSCKIQVFEGRSCDNIGEPLWDWSTKHATNPWSVDYGAMYSSNQDGVADGSFSLFDGLTYRAHIGRTVAIIAQDGNTLMGCGELHDSGSGECSRLQQTFQSTIEERSEALNYPEPHESIHTYKQPTRENENGIQDNSVVHESAGKSQSLTTHPKAANREEISSTVTTPDAMPKLTFSSAESVSTKMDPVMLPTTPSDQDSTPTLQRLWGPTWTNYEGKQPTNFKNLAQGRVYPVSSPQLKSNQRTPPSLQTFPSAPHHYNHKRHSEKHKHRHYRKHGKKGGNKRSKKKSKIYTDKHSK